MTRATPQAKSGFAARTAKKAAGKVANNPRVQRKATDSAYKAAKAAQDRAYGRGAPAGKSGFAARAGKAAANNKYVKRAAANQAVKVARAARDQAYGVRRG